MGCDYEIITKIRIYFNETDYVDIELKREFKYYHHDYHSNYKEYIKNILTPLNPIIINIDDELYFELMDNPHVKDVIKYNDKMWEDITKMIPN